MTQAIAIDPRSSPAIESLGLGLAPGDAHYRAYVGPPEDYDFIAASSYSLLCMLGLRQHHRVLDIGCSSLRIGRLLIPYLNAGHYVGIEPNRWLVEEGIARETGADQVRIKRPRFHFATSARALPDEERFDYAVAQSIFSHCDLDLIAGWLADAGTRLKTGGALAATFLPSRTRSPDRGWVYPRCTSHPPDTIAALARAAGLSMHLLDWRHPRQQWALFARPAFDLGAVRPLLRPVVAPVAAGTG